MEGSKILLITEVSVNLLLLLSILRRSERLELVTKHNSTVASDVQKSRNRTIGNCVLHCAFLKACLVSTKFVKKEGIRRIPDFSSLGSRLIGQ